MYPYRVTRWLDGDPTGPPPPPEHRNGRNAGWRHLDSFDVLAMPDPWEYPWFAAWDLAFHTVPWAHLDPAFAKYQLIVLLREWFLHPGGALPAYEWNFDDVNPPVHALAALRVFVIDGSKDVEFLERVFQKLVINFTWWLNRQDPDGNNLFGGGFLGLDNISPIDRSHLPPGTPAGTGRRDGVDGVLLRGNAGPCAGPGRSRTPCTRTWSSSSWSSSRSSPRRSTPQGCTTQTTGSSTTGSSRRRERHRDPRADAGRRDPGAAGGVDHRSEHGAGPTTPQALCPQDAPRSPETGTTRGASAPMAGSRRLLVSVVTRNSSETLLATLFDEQSFLSPHGLRSVSKRLESPYTVPGMPDAVIDYEPAESRTSMYGGNSNWRGPVWFPINYLVIRSLLQYAEFFGDDVHRRVPHRLGSATHVRQIADDLAERLVGHLAARRGRNQTGERRRGAAPPRSCVEGQPALQRVLPRRQRSWTWCGPSDRWTALVADLILDPPGRGLPRSSSRVAA